MAKDKDLSINRRIAQQRRAMGLTQAQLAEKLGMKTSTYSQMERGGVISVVMYEKIIQILTLGPPFPPSTPNPVISIDEQICGILKLLPQQAKKEVLEFAIQKMQENV